MATSGGDRISTTLTDATLGCRVDRTPTGWGHIADGPEQDD